MKIDNKKIYNKLWDGQTNDMRKYGPSFRHEMRIIMKMVDSLDFNSVLDVGCGTGELLNAISTLRPGVDISGLDISELSIETCKARFGSKQFWVKDCATEYLDQKFDLITCIDVIEHIEDDQAFLNNLSKMCGQDLILVTLEGRMRKNEPSIGHFRNYKIGQLEDMASKAGLKVVKTIRWGFPFFSPLYRDIVEMGDVQDYAYGKYGFSKKLVANLIYAIFCLNSHNKGDLVCMHLCKR